MRREAEEARQKARNPVSPNYKFTETDLGAKDSCQGSSAARLTLAVPTGSSCPLTGHVGILWGRSQTSRLSRTLGLQIYPPWPQGICMSSGHLPCPLGSHQGQVEV